MKRVPFVITALLMALLPATLSQAVDAPSPKAYNVVWDSPSEDSRGSMPTGNGDIGLNIWVEKQGDLVFYVSKTDAWGDDVYGSYGLPKVGRVRVRLSPNPFQGNMPFRQTLQLEDATIAIQAGNAADRVNLKVWVEANKPVVHVEGSSAVPTTMQVLIDRYRTKPEHGLNADTIIPAQGDLIGWCYRNGNSRIPQLTNRTFGAIVRGEGMAPVSDTALASRAKQKRFDVRLYTLTAQTPTVEAWLSDARRQADSDGSGSLSKAYQAHQKWWSEFWNRTWVIVTGDADAETVTRGYILQRFITACAGRGAFPIKFNGSLFTTDYEIKRRNDTPKTETIEKVNADYRTWGGQYWFQNTRAMYWPMLASGDFEMMLPLFRMYAEKLPQSKRFIRDYYAHDGAYFAETSPFWAELPNIPPDDKPWYTNRYYTPILELSAMLLDYYAYTGEKEIVRQTLVPMADAGIVFFEEHFPRDASGRLYMKDNNAIETYWKVNNPAPDIAGLDYVITRLLALPEDLTSAEQRARWRALQKILPPLPRGEKRGKSVLLSFESVDTPTNAQRKNGENPELYAVYPFRLYGVGKPDLALARETFAVRDIYNSTCWSQDPIHAAYLGETGVARKSIVENFSDKSRDASMRFPAFWGPFNDYTPDQDNGGNGIGGLQLMLLQADDDKVLLLPAWPKEWSARFKLHAPQQTVVEGQVKDGQLVSLMVTPRSRRKDLYIVQPDGSLTPLAERLPVAGGK